MTQTLCPYSTSPLNSAESNDEHVLPVALGAPASFSVRALVAENNRINFLIDEPTVNDPLMRFLAMSQGVVSRSGSVKAEIKGTVDVTGESIKAVFSHDGLDLKFLQPVDTDSEGRVIGVRGFGEVARQMATQVAANYAKKGIATQFENEEFSEGQQLNLHLVSDMAMIRRQLFKIAYLSSVRLFGDEAIKSKSGELFRAAMMATSNAELAACGISGAAFRPLPPGFAPPTTNSEHSIVCALISSVGLVTSVNLFGCFTLFTATPSEGITASELSGEVIVIQASKSKMVCKPYVDALPELVTASLRI